MPSEFFRHRPARGVFAVLIIRGDFRKFVTVGAPAALEGKRVQRENHHPAAKVIVCHVDLIGRLVNSNLFDSSDDHRCRRRIFLAEGRLLSPLICGLRRHLRLFAATPAAAATARARNGDESRNRSGAALTRNSSRKSWRDKWLALRRLGYVRYFCDDLAGLRIVLPNGVLSDVYESLIVHIHAVSLRRIKRSDDVALLIEMDHRRRMHTAIGDSGIQLGLELDSGQIVRTVQDPDVIVLIDGQPGHAAELPLVREWFGPIRIEFVLWRGLRLTLRAHTGKESNTEGQQAEASTQ